METDEELQLRLYSSSHDILEEMYELPEVISLMSAFNYLYVHAEEISDDEEREAVLEDLDDDLSLIKVGLRSIFFACARKKHTDLEEPKYEELINFARSSLTQPFIMVNLDNKYAPAANIDPEAEVTSQIFSHDMVIISMNPFAIPDLAPEHQILVADAEKAVMRFAQSKPTRPRLV